MLVHRHDVPAELFAVLELVEVAVVELVALLRIEVPVGQIDGQDILFALYPTIEKTALETIALDRDSIGICSTSFDINCMQHERLYSRLYMS